MLRAVLNPCCNCRSYWLVLILDGERFLETRNVRAEGEEEARKALNNYMRRHYGAELAQENIST